MRTRIQDQFDEEQNRVWLFIFFSLLVFRCIFSLLVRRTTRQKFDGSMRLFYSHIYFSSCYIYLYSPTLADRWKLKENWLVTIFFELAENINNRMNIIFSCVSFRENIDFYYSLLSILRLLVRSLILGSMLDQISKRLIDSILWRSLWLHFEC